MQSEIQEIIIRYGCFGFGYGPVYRLRRRRKKLPTRM